MKLLIKIFCFMLLTFQTACSESEKDHKNDYLLSLSWSPSYCLLDAAGKRDHAQCQERKKQYRLIVHGLWNQPQGEINSEDDHVKYCKKNTKRVSAQTVSSMFDIMPSSSLMNYTWRKHGTCSGLKQKEYFAKVRAIYKQFNISSVFQNVTQSKIFLKQQIIKNVSEASPMLKSKNFVVTCTGRILDEVRICLDKTFSTRKCDLDERRTECRTNKIYVPFMPEGF